jgi:hypothetical protein
MLQVTRNMLIALSAVVLTVGVSACKRSNDNGNEPMSAGSSGVMSNSASARGTPGDSDAANRATSAAGPDASATPAASGVAPVVTTPASGASATQ